MSRRTRNSKQKRSYEHYVTPAEATGKKLDLVMKEITRDMHRLSRHLDIYDALDVLLCSKASAGELEDHDDHVEDLVKNLENLLPRIEKLDSRREWLRLRALTERAELESVKAREALSSDEIATEQPEDSNG